MNNKKILKLNNAGSTMVEVLIGFVLLMILMASVVGIINLSSDLRMKAVDILNDQAFYQEEFYKKNHGTLTTNAIQPSEGITLIEVDENGSPLEKSATVRLESGIGLKEVVDERRTGLKVYILEK